jgi:hypothetical protein
MRATLRVAGVRDRIGDTVVSFPAYARATSRRRIATITDQEEWLLISTQPKAEMVRRKDSRTDPAPQLNAHRAIKRRLSAVVGRIRFGD